VGRETAYSGGTVKEFAEVQFREKRTVAAGVRQTTLEHAGFPWRKRYPSPLASPKVLGLWFLRGLLYGPIPKGSSLFLYFYPTAFNPSRDHQKLYSLGIREALQDVFF